jgi:DNA-3-methyladenine glycosylase II
MADYFEYGEKEVEHLKRSDKQLMTVIERIGMIRRPVISDLFSALVHSIVGQQISTKAQKILTNEFDINVLYSMTDGEVCARLSELDGIGVWTTEMLMLFSMQRPNVFSFGDLAIQRGLRMLYRRNI